MPTADNGLTLGDESSQSLSQGDSKSRNSGYLSTTDTESGAFTAVSTSSTQHFAKRDGGVQSEHGRRVIISRESQNRTALKKNKTFQELTANKLRFDSLGFYGRAKETQQINDFFDEIFHPEKEGEEPRKKSKSKEDKKKEKVTKKQKPRSTEGKKSLVKIARKGLLTVSGYSGVGKSTLAAVIKHRVMEKEPANDQDDDWEQSKRLFVRGKFDLHNRGEPYSAIAEAYGEVFRKAIRDEALYKHLQASIESDLNDAEQRLLSDVIPDFDEIVPTTPVMDVNNSSPKYNLEATNERGKYAFKVLTKIFCAYFTQLVVLLDDLQWTDVATLELLGTLMKDTHNPNALLIIGCYRSNEVNDAHILSATLRNWRRLLNEDKHHDDGSVSSTASHLQNTLFLEIELGNFELEQVHQVVTALLNMEDSPEELKGLVDVCFKRTQGNPFFLLEFMKMLCDEYLLEFQLGLFRWKWSNEDIETKTASTENVVDLLQPKMKKLPANDQRFLKYAACLGASLEPETIRAIWNKHTSQDEATDSSPFLDVDTMDNILVSLREQKFIEASGDGSSYRWVHDNLQESAISLIEEIHEKQFQFEIGQAWYGELSDKLLDSKIFDVMNLINHTTKPDKDYAQLNLQAAEKAMELSAFDSALNFASNGIRLLPTDKWESCFELSLKLYSLGAKVAGFMGKKDTLDAYYQEVRKEPRCSALDKASVNIAKLDSLSSEKRNREVLAECLNILEEFGVKFPKWKSSITVRLLIDLLSTNWKLKKMTPDDYKALPPMTDPIQMAVMPVLERSMVCSALLSQFELMALVNVKQVQITLEHGIHEFSPPCISRMAVVLIGALKDVETARILMQRSFALMEDHKIQSSEVKLKHYASAYSEHWRNPLQTCLRPFLESYESGLRVGDFEIAMWSLSCYVSHLPFVMGKKISHTEVEQIIAIAQMEEMCQEDPAVWSRTTCQMCCNLMGKDTESTTKMTGPILDGVEFKKSTDWTNKGIQYSWFNSCEIILCNFFGDFEAGVEVAMRVFSHWETNFNGHFIYVFLWHHLSLCCYGAYRITKKQKHMRLAKRVRKQLAMWLAEGNPNVKHHVLLLDAENASTKGSKKHNETTKRYVEAIIAAARAGFMHDAALANERYADYLLNVAPERDEEEGFYRIKEAIRLYEEWGACRKVNMLRDQYKRLTSFTPQEIDAESGQFESRAMSILSVASL